MQEIFDAILEFFRQYGLLGLFVYEIIETITPLAGVEVFFVLMISDPSTSWWMWMAVTAVATAANGVGAALVYAVFGSRDAWLAKKILKESDIERARRVLSRYGTWAVFIFAMTPLPFFVILFVASFVRMDFRKLLVSTLLSRGLRYFLTNLLIYLLSGVESFLGIDRFVWIGIFLTLITVPILIAMNALEKRALKATEGER